MVVGVIVVAVAFAIVVLVFCFSLLFWGMSAQSDCASFQVEQAASKSKGNGVKPVNSNLFYDIDSECMEA